MNTTECESGTVIDPPDERVLRNLESRDGITFDDLYLELLPSIHGGTPKCAYFKTRSGTLRRIGWYLTLVDDESPLEPPFRQATDFDDDRDMRVADRSIAELIECNGNCFFHGERIVPFASLYTVDRKSGRMMHPDDLNLAPLDWVTCDSVCFDRSTTPHSVVVCDANAACRETASEHYPARYDRFVEPVADSFREFLGLLTEIVRSQR